MAVRRAILGGLVLAGVVCARHPGVAPVAPPAADQNGAAGSGPVKLDALGDPLPPGALVRLGTGRLRHGGGVVWNVRFTPAGRLVSGGDDGTVRMWDVASGKELLLLGAGRSGGRGLAVSGDGRLVAAGGDAAYVWDADSGALLHRLIGGSGHTYGVAFAPDGKRLVSTDGDHVFRLWDVATGQHMRSFAAEGTFIPEAAFSPDGRLLATTHTRIVRLWDAATGEKRHALPDHNGTVYGLAFSPDGTTLAAGSTDGTVRLWDAATGQLRRTLAGHKSQVLALAYAPDGTKLASAGGDNRVRVWDVSTGAELLTVSQLPGYTEGGHGNVNCVAFSPDGATLAAGANACRVGLWDAATGRERPPPAGHEGTVTSVTFTADGKRLISGCSEGIVVGWDAATGLADRTYTRTGYNPALSPDGTVLATTNRGDGIRGWRVATGEPIFEAPERVGWLAFLSPERLLTVTHSRNQILDAATGRRVGDAPWGVLAVAPGGDLACREGAVVVMRNPTTHKGGALFILPLPTPPDRPDLKGKGRLYHSVGADCAAVSPDGKTVATASNAVLTNGVADGPGGIHATYAEDIHFWDVATGRLVRAIPLSRGSAMARRRISNLTFSPDGRTLAGGSPASEHRGRRATASFWDVASGRQVHEITIRGGIYEHIVAGPVFSPDGKTVATGGPDTTALIWPLPPAITEPR